MGIIIEVVNHPSANEKTKWWMIETLENVFNISLTAEEDRQLDMVMENLPVGGTIRISHDSLPVEYLLHRAQERDVPYSCGEECCGIESYEWVRLLT
jgi:hypothetical protein